MPTKQKITNQKEVVLPVKLSCHQETGQLKQFFNSSLLEINKKDCSTFDDFWHYLPCFENRPENWKYILQREFFFNNEKLKVLITPANIAKNGNTNKKKNPLFSKHLGTRDDMVLTCILSMLIKQGLGYYNSQLFEEKGKEFSFLISDLLNELKKSGSTFSHYQLKESLMTLAGVQIQATRKDGSEINFGSFISAYGFSAPKRGEPMRCFVVFSPVMEQSFKRVGLKVFEKKYLELYKNIFTNYLFKNILRVFRSEQNQHKKGHKFIYKISLATTLSMLDYLVNKDNIRLFENAIQALIDQGVLETSSIERRDQTKYGRKITDIYYHLSITKKFDQELAKSNGISQLKKMIDEGASESKIKITKALQTMPKIKKLPDEVGSSKGGWLRRFAGRFGG